MTQFRSSASRNKVMPKESEDLTSNPVGSRAKGLELDLHLREFEINQLTQRNNFFMIFQGVLIAGLVQSQGTSAPIIIVSMSFLGMATSVFQIGMAGGAKYWQSRWEASTRSSEIAIVLELVKRRKLAVQTFTHDSTVLSEKEREQINNWNAAHPNVEDQITDLSDYIQDVVRADINAKSSLSLRGCLDLWVRKLAIEPKWSVSRIPIWMGGSLLVFWTVIVLHSIHIREFDADIPSWWPVTLVPLKSETLPGRDTSNG